VLRDLFVSASILTAKTTVFSNLLSENFRNLENFQQKNLNQEKLAVISS
jgi:hypothetical protein